MTIIESLLANAKTATEGHFSDVHIREKEKPRIRTSAGLEAPEAAPTMSRQDILDFIVKRRPNVDFESELERRGGEYDFSFEIDNDDYRANIAWFNGHKHLLLVLRKLDKEARSLQQLGLPESLLKWLDNESGLVLVAGTTGAGKTSTLAAFVEHLNQTRSIHILTAEDPIEIRHKSAKATITQREIGRDTKDFASAARAAVREDPDVVLIGEIRDFQSALECIRLAVTGHLVLSTIHADSTDGAIDRLTRLFEGSSEQSMLLDSLASQLIGVIHQRLLKSKKTTVAGLPKRVLAYETLANSTAIEEAIRKNKIVEIRASSEMGGMQENVFTIKDVLAKLVSESAIDQETADQALSAREKKYYAENTKV